MGSRGGGSPGEDANPDSDGTDDGFLGLSLFRFFIGVFFVRGRFIDLDRLETNDVYGREEDLEIPLLSSTKSLDAKFLTV